MTQRIYRPGLIMRAATGALMLATSVVAAGSALASEHPSPRVTPAPLLTAPTIGPQSQLVTGDRLMQLAQRRGRGARRGVRRGRGFRGRGFRRGRGNRGRFLRRRGRRGRNIGPGIAAGIAGLIIGSAIVNGARARGDRSAWQRCDDRYNTFSWNDGTFQPYGDGPRKLCPYLR
jgi:hypothetical protein